MSESQYQRYADLPRQELGLMSGQLYIEDPKMVGIHLARYKFVAKMLSGKQRVAEVGCGDGWYSRIVSKEVGVLSLYDFDPMFRSNSISQFNILNGHLPGSPLDAIYSLDVMEHIHPKDEETYLTNIVDSLVDDGVFIVGMPSLESQKYASPASKIGHVNCLSHDDLKHTLRGYFKNVFLFGMNDETIHTGYGPMCHYLMAVCAGVV